MTESTFMPPRAWRALHGNALPWSLLLPLALLALWHVAAAAQWLPPQTLPAPREVLHTLLQLAGNGELFANLAISLRRLLLGVALGSALGLALGAGMGLSRRLDALLRVPLFAALQIPTLAWIPLLMLCFGIGEALKLVVIVKAVCIPMLTHARVGVRDAPPALLEVARINGLSSWRRWRQLYWPAATPALLSGLRLAVSDAWLSLLVVELLASSEGIGHLIVDGRQLFQLDVVMVGIFTFRQSEIDWLYKFGASEVYPDKWEAFLAAMPEGERDDPVETYQRLLTGDDPAVRLAAAKAWSQWEGETVTLLPDPEMLAEFTEDNHAIAIARIENHYMVHKG